jgi:hypothetical protein
MISAQLDNIENLFQCQSLNKSRPGMTPDGFPCDCGLRSTSGSAAILGMLALMV